MRITGNPNCRQVHDCNITTMEVNGIECFLFHVVWRISTLFNQSFVSVLSGC